MKENLNSALLVRSVIGCLIASFTLFGCKKDDDSLKVNQVSEKTIGNNSAIEYKGLVKFLSISLNVESNEVILNADSTLFLIRGNELNRKQMEETYRNANVYRNTYEK